MANSVCTRAHPGKRFVVVYLHYSSHHKPNAETLLVPQVDPLECRLLIKGGITMTRSARLSSPLFPAVIAALLSGCIFLPGGTVTNSATVVYTAGASQHTAAVELQVAADVVFEALVRIIKESPDIEVVNRNDQAFLIEVAQQKERRITGQVTKLGSGSSLLYIWADAGSSGESGRGMAISAVEVICDELGVSYELVKY